MGDRELERRACERFVIPGAAVRYKKEALLFSGKYTEKFYPVFDISRGGLRFLSLESLKANTKVSLMLVIPEEKDPLTITGSVRWLSLNPEKSYKYQVGVQFNPYGKKKRENDPEILERLIALEGKFLKPPLSPQR